MAAKKRSAPADKDLKKTVKKLRSQLDRTEAKADKWKKKAGKHEQSATQSEAQVKKLTKRLDKASRPSPTVAPTPVVVAEPTEPAFVAEPTEVTTMETTALSEVSDSTPDAGWTVVQLRAEARSRGLTGLSGKSKAQLLEVLI